MDLLYELLAFRHRHPEIVVRETCNGLIENRYFDQRSIWYCKVSASNPEHAPASRFCPPGWRTHAVDPSVWIGLRQLAVQRIGD